MKSQIICALAFTLFLIFLILFIPLFIISENFPDLQSFEDSFSRIFSEPELSSQELDITDESDTLMMGKVDFFLDFIFTPFFSNQKSFDSKKFDSKKFRFKKNSIQKIRFKFVWNRFF